MKANITNQLVKTIKPQVKAFEIRDTQLKGLLLRVQPTGLMVYYLEYKRGKRVKLGYAEVITPFQARELAKEGLSQAYKGEDPADKKRCSKDQTYIQYLEEVYKPWLVSNLRRGEGTYNSLKSSFKEFHPIRLYEINTWLVEKWRLNKAKQGLKTSSINRQLADLRACMRRAFEWGVIPADPLALVKLKKTDTAAFTRYLRPEEEKRLREALDSREERIREARKSANEWRKERGYSLTCNLRDRYFADHLKPAVLLSLNTGLRRGELFGLRWSDIDLENQMLTVVSANAKTGKTRYVPLNQEASTIISQWFKQSDNKEGFVFENSAGKPLHDVRSSWDKVLVEAGIYNFRWHDLRHSFASHLVQSGIDLYVVKDLMGHSNVKMTERYAHLAPQNKLDAVLNLDQRRIALI